MFDCLVAAAITLPYWKGRPKLRAAVIAVMVLCGAGIIFTLTRQVWVGAAAGAVAAMVCDRRLRRYLPVTRRRRRARRARPGVRPRVAGEFQLAHQRSGIGLAAAQLDAAALRMVEARPALGFGWGDFGKDSTPYYRLAATYPISSIEFAHNMPLSNGAELGLVGVGLWLVIGLLGIIAPAFGRAPPAVEPWRLALIAVAIAWFVQANLSPLDYAFDNYIIWLWAGIVFGGRERAAAAAAAEPAIASHRPSA